jgi:hypothetical protein
MPRQRIGLPQGLLTTVGQKLAALIGLALIYGGGVIIALAAGATSKDVQTYSGYQTVYRQLGALRPGTWSEPVKIAIIVAGLLLCVSLLLLGWAQRITPQRARTAKVLVDDGQGRVVIAPRAIERAAEFAASAVPGVHAVRARLGDGEITLIVHTRSARLIPDALRGARDRTQTALQTSGIPATTVRVTVTRFTAPSTREQLQ